MNEEWRCIKGFENYKVSNLGNVINVTTGLILKPRLHNQGYTRVALGKGNDRFIHRLVLEAFVGRVDGKPYVNHIDSNKANNRLDNLEWCDRSHNMKHAFKSGTLVMGNARKASLRSRRKEAPILDTLTGIFYDNITDLSYSLGKKRQYVSRMFSRMTRFIR